MAELPTCWRYRPLGYLTATSPDAVLLEGPRSLFRRGKRAVPAAQLIRCGAVPFSEAPAAAHIGELSLGLQENRLHRLWADPERANPRTRVVAPVAVISVVTYINPATISVTPATVSAPETAASDGMTASSHSGHAVPAAASSGHTMPAAAFTSTWTASEVADAFSPLADEADEIVFALAAEHNMSDINAAAAIDLIIGQPSLIIQADTASRGKGIAHIA